MFAGRQPESHSSEGSESLQKLHRREISLDQYLDERVERATAHLQGISTEDAQFIRRLLREQLGSNPVLAAFVQRAGSGRGLVGNR